MDLSVITRLCKRITKKDQIDSFILVMNEPYFKHYAKEDATYYMETQGVGDDFDDIKMINLGDNLI